MISLTGWQFLLIVLACVGFINAITLKAKGVIYWPMGQIIGLVFVLIIAIIETINGNY
jgi:hypothetical protein